MVAGKEPSSEGDTIGLIVELLRIDLVELMKLRVLKNIRVDSCYTVD